MPEARLDSPPSSLDRQIGLTAYATRTPGVGGRLKVLVDDFQVVEQGEGPPPDPDGAFVAARIQLANWETNAFIREASRRLGLSRKKIHFSGTKDKRGVTQRWFTFEAPTERLDELRGLSGVDVLEVRRTSTELELGAHEGNAFRVVVRDVPGDEAHIRRCVDATWHALSAMGGSPNFFGPQRFGSPHATTHRVGERIVRGDFLGAVRAYLQTPTGLSPAEEPTWVRALETGDWAAALRLVDAHGAAFERALLHRLVETKGDAIAALLALPKNLQLLFVYAYQSWMFNETVSRRLERGLGLNEPHLGDLAAPVEEGRVEEEWVPVSVSNRERVAAEIRRGRAVLTGLLPGTEAPHALGLMGDIEQAVLRDHGLQPRDFLVPEHLEWSSRGTRRALVAHVTRFSYDVADDDVHPGRRLVRFEFGLPPGSYATSFFREFAKA